MTGRDPTRIPDRRRAQCEQCKATLDVEAPHVARYASAWVPNRVGGGPNALITPEYAPGRYLCAWCVDARRRGISWTQERLFDPGPTP